MDLVDLVKAAFAQSLEAAKEAEKAEKEQREKQKQQEEFRVSNLLIDTIRQYKNIKEQRTKILKEQEENIGHAKETISRMSGEAIAASLPEFIKMATNAQKTKEQIEIIDIIMGALARCLNYARETEDTEEVM